MPSNVFSVEPTISHRLLLSLLLSFVPKQNFYSCTSAANSDMPSEVNSNHPSIEPIILSSVMHSHHTSVGPIILPSVMPTTAQ